MSVVGTRVGIAGGSIAGCAMAVAAARLGCEVTVFEASSGVLEDRGAGIFIPIPLRDELIARGYLAAGTPDWHPSERIWITTDENDPLGRVMWRHPFPGAANHWAVLWHALRDGVPDEAYRRGRAVRDCHPGDDQVTLTLEDGTTESFDVVVGADGYCSTVRRAACPDTAPAYAGYVLWRGNYSERLVSDPAVADLLDKGLLTVCFRGGHAILYLIPGPDGKIGKGERWVNWALYGVPPESLDFTEPTSLPPGRVPTPLAARLVEIADRHLPPAMAALVHQTPPEALSVQPIYDHAVPTFVSGRVVLVGDAAALSRPHTAGGATKAMQEAVAFETAGRAHDSWPELLAAFNADRASAARELVETSRRLGRGLVEDTPVWTAMTTDEVERYTNSLITASWLYRR